MTQGFVTIATGNVWYYRLALNLLHSYRLHSSNQYPFAIICDKENEVTKEFDDVIVMENALCSCVDKVVLPDYLPYDETIFIDADCLVYGDIDNYWDSFSEATSFSAFGSVCPDDSLYGWFKKDEVGDYSDSIRFIPEFNGWVYYLRKSEELEAFAVTAKDILQNYRDYRFRQFTKPADEPIFALAMAVHGFKPAGDKSQPVAVYPFANTFECDIVSGTNTYDNRSFPAGGVMHDASLIHWCAALTHNVPYRMEEYKLNRMLKGKTPGKAELALVKAALTVYKRSRELARKIIDCTRTTR